MEIMIQVLEGYNYLSGQNIMHRDLKPANILRIGTFSLTKATNGRYRTLDSQWSPSTASRIGSMSEHRFICLLKLYSRLTTLAKRIFLPWELYYTRWSRVRLLGNLPMKSSWLKNWRKNWCCHRASDILRYENLCRNAANWTKPNGCQRKSFWPLPSRLRKISWTTSKILQDLPLIARYTHIRSHLLCTKQDLQPTRKRKYSNKT